MSIFDHSERPQGQTARRVYEDAQDAMAADHARDQADKRAMDELRASLLAFIAEPPSRCSGKTMVALGQAANGLAEDAASVVRTWD